MKNILILHGSHGNPDRNWYRYLESKAKEKGYKVNIPDLGWIEKLDLNKTFNTLFEKGYINSETIIIGHSSGSVVALNILQHTPQSLVINKTILVAGFIDDDLNKELFKIITKLNYSKLFTDKWNWEKIKSGSKEFIFVYSDNDPYVPLKHAQVLYKNLGGKLVLVSGAKHFSTNTNPKFTEFPEILDFI